MVHRSTASQTSRLLPQAGMAALGRPSARPWSALYRTSYERSRPVPGGRRLLTAALDSEGVATPITERALDDFSIDNRDLRPFAARVRKRRLWTQRAQHRPAGSRGRRAHWR